MNAYIAAARALNDAHQAKRPLAEFKALQAAKVAAHAVMYCLYGPNPDSCG